MHELFRLLADTTVKAYRVGAAICYLGWAVLFLYAGVRLLEIAEGGWFLSSLGVLCGFLGAGFLMKSGETYLSAWPPERADERLRRLESQSLYIYRPRQKDRGRWQGDR